MTAAAQIDWPMLIPIGILSVGFLALLFFMVYDAATRPRRDRERAARRAFDARHASADQRTVEVWVATLEALRPRP